MSRLHIVECSGKRWTTNCLRQPHVSDARYDMFLQGQGSAPYHSARNCTLVITSAHRFSEVGNGPVRHDDMIPNHQCA